MQKLFAVSYCIISQESAENGDVDEQGNGLPYWSGSECKTVGAFNLAIETGLNYILKG